VYYHIRKLEKAGLIKVERREERQGAVARYYSLVSPAFVIVARKEWSAAGGREVPPILHGFIKDGKINCRIIVGSPDPHGPNKARARDPYYGLDLALFLGSFCGEVHGITRLDTEVREHELADNLVCIGGPVTNLVTARFADDMPLYFKTTDHWAVVSKISGNEYNEESTGIIIRIDNPLKEGKSVIVLAGRDIQGTKAAILGFIKLAHTGFKNVHDKKSHAKVVQGVDLDGDGIVDDVEVME
jgi:DNA-binding transcriptional ArsR family regulator